VSGRERIKTRYNIRIHSCVFVVNIRRWLRLTTGE
jgi:hypothetical protein